MVKKFILERSAEERVNFFTHLPGVFLGIIAFVILFQKPTDDIMQTISYGVYGATFIILFLASSLLHIAICERKKPILQRIDHAAIFLFMGGCYTPFIISYMVGELKYPFLALVWLLVITGVFYKFKASFPNRIMTVAPYILFGLLCFFVKADFLDRIPTSSFELLLLGGAFYILGTYFYIDKRIPYHHGVWHIFVLLGAGSHLYAIYNI